MKNPRLARVACGLFIGMAMTAAALPAMAQESEDIIVTGRYGPAPEDAQSLSEPVSYADLDISTPWGWSELRHRISLTARYLCDRLGESDSASVTPSCRDSATRDALNRVGTVEERYAPRGTAWVKGPAWSAPYPADWASRYPDDRYSSDRYSYSRYPDYRDPDDGY